MGLISDYIIGGGAGTPKRLRRMAGIWRGLLSGHDQRAAELERIAARGMLLECEDADLDGHLRNTGDQRAPLETDRAVRAYLARRTDAYKEASTPEGLRRQLARFGIPSPSVTIVREIDLRKGGIIGAFGGNIGYYFLVISPPSPFSGVYTPAWDDGTSEWDGDVTFGGLPVGFIDALRTFIRRWEASGESCRFVVAGADNTFTYNPVTFTWANADVYPVQKAWEWEGGLQPYYAYDYLTP